MGQPCRLLLIGSMDSGSSRMDQVGPSFPINRDDGGICECHSQLLEAEVNSRRLQRAPLNGVGYHDQLGAAGNAECTRYGDVHPLSNVAIL